jgi:NTE family protein
MHVVRLTAPRLPNDDITSDIDFTRDGIELRREAGYRDGMQALRQQPWKQHRDVLDGVVIHEIESPSVG